MKQLLAATLLATIALAHPTYNPVRTRGNYRSGVKSAVLHGQRRVITMSAEEKAQAQGAAIDWRTKGAVGPVLDASDCGGDWAIAAAGNIEGVWAASGKPFVSASAQELLLCDTLSMGCSGGGSDPTLAFKWLTEYNNGTIATAASMPWNILTPQCPANFASLPTAATIRGYVSIEMTEDAIAAYVYANGPIIVSLDVSSWSTYQGGIFTNCGSQEFDQFNNVLVVGYNDTNVPPYWIFKGYWGPQFGENGFIRVEKGSNQCSIESACISPSSVTL